MKLRLFFLTLILFSGVVLYILKPSYAHTVAEPRGSTVKSAILVNAMTYTINGDALSDVRVAICNFLEYVSYARVALAMNKTELARQLLTQAHQMLTLVRNAPLNKRSVNEVTSNHIIYQYHTTHQNYYFPVQIGLIETNTMKGGPLWTENNLEIADADVVYLSISLDGEWESVYLDDAEAAIAKSHSDEADEILAELVATVAHVDSTKFLPRNKIVSTIALVRSFIASKHYEGARYALKHADNSLDQMWQDKNYKTYHQEMTAMRQDLNNLQGYIIEKDKTKIEAADKKLDKWYSEVRNWPESQS